MFRTIQVTTLDWGSAFIFCMSEEEVIPNVYHRDSIFWVEIDRIKPNPFQPRREFEEAKLRELSESIRMYGLLQPLTVTRNEIPREDGGLFVEYELVAGERRLRASKLAGLVQVPVIIRTGVQTDQMKLELAIIENLQREDLNSIDRAKAFDRLAKEFGFKHIDIGVKVGKSREFVSNSIRLLSLPEEIQSHIAQGKITEGHTRPLLMLNDRPEEQTVLAKEILLKRLTVREAEAIARRIAQDKVRKDKYRFDPALREIEQKLMDKLGTRVHIEPKEVGGRLIISYFSPDDLQSLLAFIQAKASGLATPQVSQANTITNVTLLDALEGDPVLQSSIENSETLEEVLEDQEDHALIDDRSREEREAAEAELYSISNFSI